MARNLARLATKHHDFAGQAAHLFEVVFDLRGHRFQPVTGAMFSP
jgi:hypothetical protein